MHQTKKPHKTTATQTRYDYDPLQVSVLWMIIQSALALHPHENQSLQTSITQQATANQWVYLVEIKTVFAAPTATQYIFTKNQT